jgi:hypothetical protein
MSRYISTKNVSSNGQTVSKLWPFKVSPKVGECGKLESGLNFDETVPNKTFFDLSDPYFCSCAKNFDPKTVFGCFLYFLSKQKVL